MIAILFIGVGILGVIAIAGPICHYLRWEGEEKNRKLKTELEETKRQINENQQSNAAEVG